MATPVKRTNPPKRYEYSELHMGTRVRIVLYSPEEEQARRAARAGFRRFAELEDIMSDYRPKSELNLLAAKSGGGPVKVSADLFKVLKHARGLSRDTGGAFDVTASPAIWLWRAARRSGEMPGWQDLEDARRRTGWQHMVLDGAARTVDLQKEEMQLDLGGIAKGYACDEALEAMAKNGISSAMVQAGGDIAASGPPPGRAGWVLTIRGTEGRQLTIWDQAVSTSGDSEQYVEIGGRRWSHVVDPRTALAKTDRVQATVIAERGMVTDSLATAFSVLGPVGHERLARRYGAQVIFVVGK